MDYYIIHPWTIIEVNHGLSYNTSIDYFISKSWTII